jgi:DNA-binding MltR family transcriptional regulator
MSKITDPTIEEILAWVSSLNLEFKGQSDRSLAIVAGSFLDEFLTILIRGFIVEDKKLHEELFQTDRPFSTFSAKIKVAYALGLISSREKKELDVIRETRNKFAHTVGLVSFSDQSIKDKCGNLTLSEELYIPEISSVTTTQEESAVSNPTSTEAWETRVRFIKAVEVLTSILTTRYAETSGTRLTAPEPFKLPEEMLRRLLAQVEILRKKKANLNPEPDQETRERLEFADRWKILMTLVIHSIEQSRVKSEQDDLD